VSFTRLWAFLAIGLPVLAAVIAPFPSVDLTYHLRAGADILDTRAIPTVDTWTFTVAGQPWLDQQWLAQAVMAAVFRIGGWTGLVILRAALVGVAFGLLFDLCRRRAGSVRVAAWLTLGAFVCASITLGLRPQLFGIAIFGAVLWLVARRHEEGRFVWLVGPLVAAWANVHGSFVLAPVMVGIALVEDLVERRRSWNVTAGLLATAIAATFLNPFGVGVWRYATGISTNSVITKRITEWQPTSPLTLEGGLFFVSVVLVALVVVLVVRRGRPPPWSALLWLVPFAVLGAWAVRGLAWWPFVAAMSIAPLLRRSEAPAGRERSDPPLIRRLNAGIVAILALVAVAALPLWRPLDRGLQAPVLIVGTAPSGITGALREIVRPGDHLLAPQPWGSWFEYALPEATVAVDSRIELYPVAVWDAIDRIDEGAPGWEQLLREWRVSLVVATPDQHDLVQRLTLSGWREDFHDEDGWLLVRRSDSLRRNSGIVIGAPTSSNPRDRTDRS
jgi:hypothetical protein